MDIVDLQLHEPALFAPNEAACDIARKELVKEVLQQMMDAVGVTAVVAIPRWDPTYIEELALAYPGRFASVRRLLARNDHGFTRSGVTLLTVDDDITEVISRERDRPGAVGVRLTFGPRDPDEYQRLLDGQYDRVLRACERQGLAVFVFAIGVLPAVDFIARTHPGLQVILDHYGLPQRPSHTPDEPQWRNLDSVLQLARYPNVALKVCGAPAMSKEGYPFTDVWPYVERTLDTFGLDRVAWASDISRFRGARARPDQMDTTGRYVGKHTYLESLSFFLHNDQLTVAEKEKVLGGTARRLLDWPLQSG